MHVFYYCIVQPTYTIKVIYTHCIQGIKISEFKTLIDHYIFIQRNYRALKCWTEFE